jgi:hypothetical protein
MKEQTTLTLTNAELEKGNKINDLLIEGWLIVTITPLHRIFQQEFSAIILFERDKNNF